MQSPDAILENGKFDASLSGKTELLFEERIDEMIQKKKHLAEMTVATGENWIGKLSNKELREIFG